ncbi:hypothetical protein [Streptomyces phaeochromogenes]
MDIRFVINARANTLGGQFRAWLRPRGWLTAPDNLPASLRPVLAAALRGDRWLVVDNGNFADIDSVVDAAQAPLDTAVRVVSDLQAMLGRTVRRADLPNAARSDLAAAMEALQRAATITYARADTRLAAQLALPASHLIGVEDITLATALRGGLTDQTLPWSRTQVRARNQRTVRRATTLRAALAPARRLTYYPVASALNYDHAADAGRLFAAAGLDRAAIGCGAYMADDSYADGYQLGRRWISLPDRLPNRYLRTALVVRGFIDGYRAVVGQAPTGLHLLGLGAPIMLAVTARAAVGVSALSFDATSPIKDAVQATLYTNEPAYLKIRTWKIADRLLTNLRAKWTCPCPPCRAFTAAHPFEYEAARTTWPPGQDVTIDALRPGGLLYPLFPLLCEPAGGPLRVEVSTARMAHNHWVLQGICRHLQLAATNDALDAKLATIIRHYRSAAGATRFADAIELAGRIGSGQLR